jgi:hypothetical protein
MVGEAGSKLPALRKVVVIFMVSGRRGLEEDDEIFFEWVAEACRKAGVVFELVKTIRAELEAVVPFSRIIWRRGGLLIMMMVDVVRRISCLNKVS